MEEERARSQTADPAGGRLIAQTRVLVLEDDPEARAFVRWELRRHLGEADFVEIADRDQLVEAMRVGADVVITERVLSWTDGLSVLDEVRRLRPGTPVVMHTAPLDAGFAVEAMRRGLDDIVENAPHAARCALGARGRGEHQRDDSGRCVRLRRQGSDVRRDPRGRPARRSRVMLNDPGTAARDRVRCVASSRSAASMNHVSDSMQEDP